MKTQKLLAAATVLFTAAIAYGEMPQPPNFEELCADSNLVIMGEPVKKVDLKSSINLAYQVITFKVNKVYKAPYSPWEKSEASEYPYFDNLMILGSDHTQRGKCLNVLIQSQTRLGCRLTPAYEPGKKYILFLGPMIQDAFYTRAAIDDVWGEREWDKNKEQQIIEELKFLSDPNRWKIPSDNLNYTIPKDANEKIVELTEYQKKHKFSKRAQYWLNGKPVGERAWYRNGRLAYEQPLKNGMRHGISKGWYADGKPFEVRPYRKDRLHGILKQWDKKGNLKTSYWIRGKPVTKVEYIKASKTNATLPRCGVKKLTKPKGK